MRYSIEPRYRIYVRGYGFLSSANIMGKHATEVAKNMSNKYSQKRLDSAKKSGVDAIKTPSKRAIQKTAEANKRNKGVIFKNCAPFTNCKSEINNTEIDHAKDIDIVMPMYNLIEYGDNYSKTCRSL